MSTRSYHKLLCSLPVTLAITTLALSAFAFESLASSLEIHLAQPHSISLLQLVGCHLLHWTSEHLFWDLAMFIILGIICERWLPRTFALTLATCAVAIPLFVMWVHPEIDVYRGLSGLDTAVFSLLVTTLWLRSMSERDLIQSILLALLLLALWGKIAVEFQTGRVLFVQQVNFEPLPVAHAVGALLGSLFAFGNTLEITSFFQHPKLQDC